jgi:F-type H+-transporting ATPase subunit delta
MKIGKQARREAKELFRSCVVDGQLDEECVRRAVRRVTEARPRGYLAMLSHFERLVKLELERRTARIESAVPLTGEMQNRVSQQLARSYGPGLRTIFMHRPELIGGLRVQVGSDVYDGSVRARLAALEQSF